MAKKGGKKGKPMVVSKVKRANHLKHKKGHKSGGNKAIPNASNRSLQTKNDEKSPRKTERPSKQLSAQKKDKPSFTTPKSTKGKKAALVKPSSKGVEGPVEEFEADEMMDMMEDEDVDYLRNTAHLNGNSSKKRKRPEEFEEEYDQELLIQDQLKKKTRPLLPIKTKKGVVEMSVEVEEEEEIISEEENVGEEVEEEEQPPLSAAEMYAQRQKKIEDLKALIGSSSSNILESPEERMENISGVLKLYKQLTPDILITGFKLISASLVELFKDLAPGFEIKNTNNPGDRLKKTTREVYGNEGKLLKYYQMFLKKLEETFTPLKEGKKNKKVDEVTKRTAIFALKCMSDLLIAMPHFNFSQNIVNALIPFSAHKLDEVRLPVCAAFKQLFKEDKRGEISLQAVRQVNHLIKNKRHHQIPPDCLDMLITLRIKDVNLDREREEEIGRYKTLKRKEKLLIMSKNERRRHKKIERLQKEIVTAKAERNKESKTKFQSETVKIVFTIYFRVLKMAPKSVLMGVVLQGLAKFAHTINVDFFGDLVEVFNNLIANQQLDYRQCLFAIQVVLIMLSGQGEALNIDPLHFYTHLYKMLFYLTAGPSNNDVPIALDCLDNMLIKRRKKVSVHRVLAFTKRICTLALQVQHNSGIALLNLVRIIMMTHRQTDMLLDLDSTSGSGSFLPELEEPEHCNAGSTALWELHALTRHYHPVVGKFARHLLLKCPTTGNGILPMELTRKSPHELHLQYDPSELAFLPAVPGPASTPICWKKMKDDSICSPELEEQISRVLATDHLKLWEKGLKRKPIINTQG